MKTRRDTLALPLMLLFVFPLIASFFFAARSIFDLAGWAALFIHPQLWSGLQLSLITGLVSASLSVLAALLIVSGLYQTKWWPRIPSQVGAMLAVPHLAMAIGLAFLIMPSGFIARGVAMFTGWQTPPNWISTHDPYGLALVASLVIKETPFLMWILVSILNREDVQRNFAGQRAAAVSLGHDMKSIWLRIFLPQILPKLIWPLLVVFTYAATVVDMALVIGPTQPPPFATIVWADINDADILYNARGAAGAVFLSLAVAGVATLVWGLVKAFAMKREWLVTGPTARDLIRPSGPFSTSWRSAELLRGVHNFTLLHTSGEGGPTGRMRSLLARILFSKFLLLYLVVTATLILLSFAILWPFPQLWPQTLSTAAWLRVWSNPSALITSLLVAGATTATAIAIIIAWMESQPQRRDKLILLLSASALGLPAILLTLGQYRAFLLLNLTGTATGLFLAHLIPVTAYMFIVLAAPYRSFDPRWRASASGLLCSVPKFLWAIKFPLLKAPLLAASAIGFAVSFGQYVPAQLIAAGRYSTLPMEAVTLTSGTNRPLTAAFALLLMCPPLLAFITAAHFGKSRWSTA